MSILGRFDGFGATLGIVEIEQFDNRVLAFPPADEINLPAAEAAKRPVRPGQLGRLEELAANRAMLRRGRIHDGSPDDEADDVPTAPPVFEPPVFEPSVFDADWASPPVAAL